MLVQKRDHKRVGQVLADARNAAGVTQADLAKRLKKPQSFVSNYESGQRRVDILELFKIAEALDADAVDLCVRVAKAGRRK